MLSFGFSIRAAQIAPAMADIVWKKQRSNRKFGQQC
jgi:hypothetical protein